MVIMTKYDLEPITKTHYEALEEGTILGRKCTRCGHIEFPPYLCCNACGCLDTEWVDLTNMRGRVKQALPTKGAFGDPDFRKTHGDYFAVEIEVPGADPVNTSLLHVDYDKYEEFAALVRKEEVLAKPLLIQDEDTKVVVWELAEDSEFKKIPDQNAQLKEAASKAKAACGTEASEAKAACDDTEASKVKAACGTQASGAELDEIAKTVIQCAAEAYEADPAGLTLATDIREDLSNESMKMIVMISSIEDELDVTIEIQEASLLNTLEDFVNKVKEKM